MAKNNKPASAYTGFAYPSDAPNPIGVYKQPMENMHSAPDTVIELSGNPMTEFNSALGTVNKGIYKPENPQGVGEMRGYGAATKGRKISGKMG